MATGDVIIVGGGVIGLGIAWQAARQGQRVTLLERGTLGGGASHVAAGMLAPASEVEFGGAGAQLLELGLRSAALWPGWARELDVELRAEGTLQLARDGEEADLLERELAHRERHGLAALRLRAAEARELEPALGPRLRAAALLESDRWLDPRELVQALVREARRAGAELREHTEVLAAGERSVELAGERLEAGQVVVAAGAWSGALGAPVRPVKGQIFRLRDPQGPGLLRRVLRWDGGYLVPRSDGRYVLGATVEERGFDVSVTAGALHRLLQDAAELLPGVLEWELEEAQAGLRPGTRDNLPLLESLPAGPQLATGHYRNGILLCPLTAQLIACRLERVAA